MTKSSTNKKDRYAITIFTYWHTDINCALILSEWYMAVFAVDELDIEGEQCQMYFYIEIYLNTQ